MTPDPVLVATFPLPLDFAGVVGGLLGVGGGIVPILLHLFPAVGIDESIRMHLAVGTSLSTIVVTSLAPARAHHGHGRLGVRLFRILVAGTVAVGYASADVLKRVFGVIALAAAAYWRSCPQGWRWPRARRAASSGPRSPR